MIRLGIIEDDRSIRESLVCYFNNEPGFNFLLEAESVEHFFESWNHNLYFDIILMDIGLPGISGINGVRMIKKQSPRCQAVMLTNYEDSQNIFQSLCAGASGYISKKASFEEIKKAIQTVMDGGAYLTPGVARKITEYFNPTKPASIQSGLTQREQQVLHAIEEGLPNKEIAIRLNISMETVKSHVKKIYFKLEVTNRLDIVRGKYQG